MWSIAETIENGKICVTLSPGIRIVGHILHWPPSDNPVDRRSLVPPGPDWIPHMCRVLKENIGTYEEALELEKCYSKHRDSDEFRNEQEKIKFKRAHPVNCNQSGLDLIDVNDMTKEIDAAEGADAAPINAGGGSSTQGKINYHKQCTGQFSSNSKAAAKPIIRSVTKTRAKAVKKPDGKAVTKLLPFQNNYLKSGVSVLKKRAVRKVTEPKRPRYDNFLKSRSKNQTFGKLDFDLRSRNSTKNMRSAPSATITKKEYLKKYGETNDIDSQMTDEELATVHGDCARKIPSDNSQENLPSHDPGSKAESPSFNINTAELPNEENEDRTNRSDLNDARFKKKINILGDVLIKPPTQFSSQPVSASFEPEFESQPGTHFESEYQPGTRFEDDVLKHLDNLTKAQKASEERQFLFEARIEKRLDTFFNDQSRIQGPSRSIQSRSQFQDQQPTRLNDQSRMQGPIRSIQYHPQRQHREPHHIVHDAIPDLDDFEEFDQNFPIQIFENVAALEYNIRKDLELKFQLKSRLDEITADEPTKAIRLKMKYLFSDVVLERYSWRGTIKKDPFKRLKSLNNLILMSVRQQFEDFKQFQYNAYMVQWLKHSKSRQRKVIYSYPDRESR